MKSRQVLVILLALVVSILAFQPATASAAPEICLVLTHSPGFTGSGPITLRAAIMNFGKMHYSVAGTEEYTLTTNPPVTVVHPLHGNAELIDGNLEISLNGTGISGDLVDDIIIHLEINPETLNGIFVRGVNGSSSGGTAAVETCPH